MAAMAGLGPGPVPGVMAEPGPGPVPVAELVAELRGPDGQARSVRVPYPAAAERGGAAELRGLRVALCELQERVVELLAPLVQRERGGGGAGGEEDGDEEDEEVEGDDEEEGEEENHVEARAGGGDPPPKRSKVQRP